MDNVSVVLVTIILDVNSAVHHFNSKFSNEFPRNI